MLKLLHQDIMEFLEANEELLFNERDLQMHLAIFLKETKRYKDVDIEYHLPIGFNPGFDKDYKAWETEKPSIDLVVFDGKEYIPIELKFKLKAIKDSISRFGERSGKNLEIVSNQSAQNIGRYAFWKDVKRLELLKKHYINVKSGLAVFATNDRSYMKSTVGANYYAFRMDPNQNIHGILKWDQDNYTKTSYPSIEIDGRYNIKWSETTMNNGKEQLFFTILDI